MGQGHFHDHDRSLRAVPRAAAPSTFLQRLVNVLSGGLERRYELQVLTGMEAVHAYRTTSSPLIG